MARPLSFDHEPTEAHPRRATVRPHLSRGQQAEAQLNRMFAGPRGRRWTAHLMPLPVEGLLRRFTRGPRLIPTVLGVILFGGIAAAIVAVQGAHAHHLEVEHAELAAHLEDLLEPGRLAPVATLLPPTLNWTQWHGFEGQASLALADAVLYRYYDADPRRRARLLAWLDRANLPETATLTVQLLVGVAAVGKAETLTEGPLHQALVAMARALRAPSRDAGRLLSSAADLAPVNVPVLFSAAASLQHRGQIAQAATIVRDLETYAADEGWTQIARARQALYEGGPVKARAIVAAIQTSSADWPSVQRAELNLTLQMIACVQGDVEGASRAFRAARTDLGREATTILDGHDDGAAAAVCVAPNRGHSNPSRKAPRHRASLKVGSDRVLARL